MNTKRIILLLCILIAIPIVSLAGTSPTTDLGNQYYKEFDFKKAVACYEQALKHDKKNIYLLQHIADCYRLMNNWPAARPYYAQLAAHNRVAPLNLLYYAQALRATKDYPHAKTYYSSYLAIFPDDSSVKEQLRWIDRTDDMTTGSVVYEVKNMKGVNTEYSEFGVTLYGPNDVYFCSNRKSDAFVKLIDNWTNGSFLKLYTAEVIDSAGTLKNSSLLPSTIINKKYHEAAPCYNAKLNELYFDRSNYKGKRPFFSVDKTVKLKIYKVGWRPDQAKWDDALQEGVPFNSREYSVCHPSLTKNGDTLYFTSDMPGGLGRADIYVSARKADGQWGDPVNLGPGINTPEDDMFPFITEDGTLYFSSSGHMGLGGLDVFTSKYEGGKWSEAKNIGSPINSNYDDFGLVMRSDNKQGFFCSNRTGGAGDDDIYSFIRKGVMQNGVAYNVYTGDSIEGVTVEIKPDIEPAVTTTGKGGAFTYTAEPNSDLVFIATKEGFHDTKLNFRVKENSGTVRIPMYPRGDVTLQVTVRDKKTHQLLDSAEVAMTEILDTDPTMAEDDFCYTNAEGICTFVVDTNKRYRIDAYKETGDSMEKYLRVSAEVSSKGYYPPSVIKQVIELDKVKKVVPIKIENIYYDLDKWFIRPDAAIELDRLVKIMKDNPTMEIELSSHTDCRASALYNMILSKKRAQSAVDYIISQGIDSKRMVAAGYGESKLVNKCQCEGEHVVSCTEDQHQENRRTEFKIKKF